MATTVNRAVWLKRLLFSLPLLLLLLPALQARLKFVEMPELGGYSERAPHPSFEWAELYATTYQPALEKYVEDRIGFRELFIRLRNQLAFSIFDVCRANAVLVGKDDVLLDEVAIRASLGQNFKGPDAIRVDVHKLKAVQDTLARRGILLVFAIVPDKANYYADKQPDYFQRQPHGQTNYAAYAREMQKKGVNLIDLAHVFQQWKDTTSYPLFPKGGIHWSGYGIPRAADTLFRYIEQRGQFDLPDYAITGHTTTDEPRGTDDDIAKSLNLIRHPATDVMSYAQVDFQPLKPGQKKPHLLVVGDSFVWSLFIFYPFIPNLFDEPTTQFWYYNTEVQRGARPDMPADHMVWKLDRKAEILRQDVVLVLFTQHNLVGFDNGFSAKAFEMLCPYSPAAISQIQALEQKLRNNPAVQDSLWKQTHDGGQDYSRIIHDMAVKEYDISHF